MWLYRVLSQIIYVEGLFLWFDQNQVVEQKRLARCLYVPPCVDYLASYIALAMKKSTSSVQLVTWGVKLVGGLVLNPGISISA